MLTNTLDKLQANPVIIAAWAPQAAGGREGVSPSLVPAGLVVKTGQEMMLWVLRMSSALPAVS